MEHYAGLGPFLCPLGPFLGLFSPAASDIVFWQERQIVRPALGLHGFLPEISYYWLRFGSRGSPVRIRAPRLWKSEAPLEVTASGGVFSYLSVRRSRRSFPPFRLFGGPESPTDLCDGEKRSSVIKCPSRLLSGRSDPPVGSPPDLTPPHPLQISTVLLVLSCGYGEGGGTIRA